MSGDTIHSEGQRQVPRSDSENEGMRLRLHMSDGKTVDHVLTDGTYSIGRAGLCEIQIPSTPEYAGISHQHGSIEVSGDTITYTDQSTNGTFLSRAGSNFQRLTQDKKTQLKTKDRLRFDTLLGEIIFREAFVAKTELDRESEEISTTTFIKPDIPLGKSKCIRIDDVNDGQPIALPSGVTKIGRHGDNDIVIPDRKEYRHISRYHAEILVERNRWEFRDVGSSHGSHTRSEHGSYYKLKANNPYPLKSGQVIRIGSAGQKRKEKTVDIHCIEE